MKGSFRLGRIAGIEIGIHYSWILIFVLVATTLAFGLFQGFDRRLCVGPGESPPLSCSSPPCCCTSWHIRLWHKPGA